VARTLGERHNKTSGIAPVQWLQQFGRSLNMGSGLKLPDQPLPLSCFPSPQSQGMALYENGQACPSLQPFLQIEIQDMQLMATSSASLRLQNCLCRVRLLGNAMSRPPVLLGSLACLGGGPTNQGNVFQCPALLRLQTGNRDVTERGASRGKVMSAGLYPVHHDLSTTLLMFEVGGY
jgi:hypothetical protein